MNFNQFLISLSILSEAAYDSKVATIKKQFPDQTALIDSAILKLQKKQDRIFWFLKILEEVAANKLSKTTTENYSFKSLKQLLTDIEHFLSYSYEPIQKVIFTNKSIEDLLIEFSKLEQQYLDKLNREKGVTLQEGDIVLFDFGATKWWLLSRAYCEDEGRSGKHCGNVVGKELTNQRILSLRNAAQQVILTFILEPENDSASIDMKNPHGYLGEMKAKGNTKPQEKYHKEIMKLLLSPVVKGLRGEGYLPEANFSIFDLNENHLKMIDQKKSILIEDQIEITPTEALKMPEELRKKYKDAIISSKPSLKNLLNDQSLENWVKAVKEDSGLILAIPTLYQTSFPDFKEKIIKELMKSEKNLLKVSKEILNDLSIITPVIKKRPHHIAAIPHTNKNYIALLTIAAKQNFGVLDFGEKEHKEKVIASIAQEHQISTSEIVINDLTIENNTDINTPCKVWMGNLTIRCNTPLIEIENMPTIIYGNFDCARNSLTSLKGAPQTVMGDFTCSGNSLTSLKDAPSTINGSFTCSQNSLISLKGVPSTINGSFNCAENSLTSLEGAPSTVNGSFICAENSLTSLEGAPSTVNGSFNCAENSLTSLEGAPSTVNGSFNCTKNSLTSLEGAPQIVNRFFNCSGNSLITLKGAPQIVNGYFICSENSLISLSGAPKRVEGNFSCPRQKEKKFREKEVLAVCDVIGSVIV